MRLETAKGMEDYEPREKILRNSVVNTLQNIFENYGFNPLETPVMEKWGVLSSKYAGGDEILKETYKLTDQGGRELGLRYDLTVPLARYIGMNPTLKMPFKRYQIGPVFRDGPVKKGRRRQFYQADVDIIGSESMFAEAELIKLTLDAFDKIGIPVKIRVNNRKLLNDMIEQVGIREVKAEDAILSLDKLLKIGGEGVVEEMKERGIDQDKAYDLLDLVEDLQSEELILLETEFQSEGAEELKQLFELVDDDRLEFDPSLARGLAYYTGTIFEVFTEEFDSSLAAGGRYDEMIGQLVERGDYPAVGISFGVEPICTLLADKVEVRSTADVLIIPIGVREQADKIADELRSENIKTDIDVVGRGVSKNLSYADWYDIHYCLIIGEDEVEQEKYTLKDMDSGDEEMLSLEDVKKRLKEKI